MSVHPYRVQSFTGGVPVANTRHITESAAALAVYSRLREGREIVHVLFNGHSVAKFTPADAVRDILPDIHSGTNAARDFKPVPRGRRRREVQALLSEALGGDWSRAYDVLTKLRPYLK